MAKKIFVTGGAGYVGAALVPMLLSKGYSVSVLDLMIYGDDVLDAHPNLTKISGDIRDEKTLEEAVDGHDAVIHLACISNDPSFELNPALGKSINLDAFRPLVGICKNAGVERFIYASSSSVYGVKTERDVHEGIKLEPLTDYSKYKADCERLLLEYLDNHFTTVIARPATVCGYSRRQRLDVVVNILTNLAYHKREIKVFGGDQLRPNIHISDMINAYLLLLESSKDQVSGQTYNIGYENHSVMEIAKIVKNVIGDDVRLRITPTDDNRSYHISSAKIKNELGFENQFTIEDAVKDIKSAFEAGLLTDTLCNESYYNIKRMQSLHLE